MYQTQWTAKQNLPRRKRDRPFEDVLQARFRAHRTSSRLFEELIRDSELQTPFSVAIEAQDQAECLRDTERSKWLEQCENEILEHKVMTSSSQPLGEPIADLCSPVPTDVSDGRAMSQAPHVPRCSKQQPRL
jgi:hypothetical protein